MLRTLEPEMTFQKNDETTEPWKIHDTCKKEIYSNSDKGLKSSNKLKANTEETLRFKHRISKCMRSRPTPKCLISPMRNANNGIIVGIMKIVLLKQCF